jgi:hypothetical protein
MQISLDTATRHLSFRAGALSFRLLNLWAALLSSRWLSRASKCKAGPGLSLEPWVSLVITLASIKWDLSCAGAFGRALDLEWWPIYRKLLAVQGYVLS